MQWNGINVHIVVLALLVGLGGLWGGQWALKDSIMSGLWPQP